jgi:hypothetical protein
MTATAEKVNEAQDYASTIADHVALVEEICGSYNWQDLSPESLELAKDYGVSLDESPFDVAHIWLNSALEIRKTVSLATNDVTGYEFLVTFGGPTCWVDFDGSDYATVRAYWGCDKGERRIYAHELEEYVFTHLGE